MDLSVIIVSYKGREKLNRCLESLDSFTGDHFTMEVIIVDNNTGDEAFNELEKKYKRFSFIRNIINGGFANGCNLGAENAKGVNLLFLNPDTVANEEAVSKLLYAAGSDQEYYIISCRQISTDRKERRAIGTFPGFRHRCNSQKQFSDKKQRKSVLVPDWVSGSVMMMRKEIFCKLKGFDEDFWMYSEDVDICKRARNLGGEIGFYTDITITHDHGGSSRSDLKTTSITKCEVQISKHLFIHKHKSGTERIYMHSILAADNLITGFITGIVGLIFFFIPLLFVRFLIFVRILNYYLIVFTRKSWISPRSVNFHKRGSVK